MNITSRMLRFHCFAWLLALLTSLDLGHAKDLPSTIRVSRTSRVSVPVSERWCVLASGDTIIGARFAPEDFKKTEVFTYVLASAVTRRLFLLNSHVTALAASKSGRHIVLCTEDGVVSAQRGSAREDWDHRPAILLEQRMYKPRRNKGGGSEQCRRSDTANRCHDIFKFRGYAGGA